MTTKTPRKLSVSIDMKKLERDLKKAYPEICDKVLKSVSANERKAIGEDLIEEIKSVVAKGASPIHGKGRFAAYKWAAMKNAIKKSYRDINKGLKGDKSKNAKNYKKNLKGRQLDFESEVKRHYPYSKQKEFPQKKERPVNLTLSGAFLKMLKVKTTKDGFEIGFYDSLSIKKEMGHREGVNGQPSRPIIPQDGEQFSSSIYRRLVKKLTEVIKRKKIRT